MKINRTIYLTLFSAQWALPTAFAQPIDTLQLPEVVISDQRMDIPFSAQSRSLTMIRRAEIAAAPVNSVAELLQYVAGVDVRQRGANGVQADVGLRGGTFDQTLILLNGVRLSDLQTGHHSMNLPVDLEAIERIEVLKGPAARIYGQNAFTGAINIVTQAPQEALASVRAQTGSYGLRQLGASVSLPTRAIRHFASYSRDIADGYRYNTDYRMHTAYYQAERMGEKSDTRFFGAWSGRDFGANGFYGSPTFTEQYEAIQTVVLNLNSRIRAGNWILKPRASWRFNQDEYIFTRANPAAYRNLHRTQSANAELHASKSSVLGLTGLGVEWSRQWLYSNRLGERNRSSASFFAEQRWQSANQKIDLTPGLLLSYYSDFGLRLFPGIEGGWEPRPGLRFYGNAGYTYRVPTFTDLYYQDPGNRGNPDLQPESALSWEGGLKWQRAFWTSSLVWFSRRSKDLIDWTKASPTDTWETRNLGNVWFRGMETALAIHPGHWMQRAQVAYTYIQATQANDPSFLSKYALDQLRHQLLLSADIKWGRHLFPSFRLRYLDRLNLADYQVLDARLRWQTSRWAVFVEATNLGNTVYTETNLVPMPGRWVSLGGQIRFSKKEKD